MPSIIWIVKELLHGWCKKGIFSHFPFYSQVALYFSLFSSECVHHTSPKQRTRCREHSCQGRAQSLKDTWLREQFCPLENTAIMSLVTSGAFCLHLQQSNTVTLAARITLESICKLLSLLESHLAIIASSAILTRQSPQNSNGKSRVITLFTEANQYIKAEDLLHWRQPVCMARKCI